MCTNNIIISTRWSAKTERRFYLETGYGLKNSFKPKILFKKKTKNTLYLAACY